MGMIRIPRLPLSLGLGLLGLGWAHAAQATICPPNYFLDANHVCVPLVPLDPNGKPIYPSPGTPLTPQQMQQLAPPVLVVPEAKRGTLNISTTIANRVSAMIRPAAVPRPVLVPPPAIPTPTVTPAALPRTPTVTPTAAPVAPGPTPGMAPQPGQAPSGGGSGAAPAPGAPPQSQPGSPPPNQPEEKSPVKRDDLSNLARMRGVSAGSPGVSYGVWSNLQHTYTKNNDIATMETRSATIAETLGGDVKPLPSLLLGVAVVHDTNKSTIAEINRVETDTYTTVPYAAYSFNDYVTADLLVGWSNTDDPQNTLDTRRWMTAMGIRGYYVLNRWLFSSRLGYILSDTELKTTSEKTRFDQASLQTEASTSLSTGWIPMLEPYFGMTLEHDTHHEGTVSDYDDEGVLFSVGSRLQFTPTLNGEVKYETNQERRNLTESTFMGNLRYEF